MPEPVLVEVKAGPMNPDPEGLPWIEIVKTIRSPTVASRRLGKGEEAVISLALERPRDLLAIVDDGRGRKAARDLGLRHTGVLGVLLAGKAAGIVAAVAPYIQALEDLEPPFFMDELLIAQVLKLAGESGVVIRLNLRRGGRKGPKRHK